MLRAAISLFMIGLLAFVLGANNIAGLTFELGRIILFIFVVLSVLSFLTSIFTGKKISSGL